MKGLVNEMNIDEALQGKITSNLTYDVILHWILGERYKEEMDKIERMTTDEFYEYFELLLESEGM